MSAATKLPKLKRGWRSIVWQGCPMALCPEGLMHTPVDGLWRLYVPWFRGRKSEIAILRDAKGEEVEAHIDDASFITTPKGRKVGPREWYH